MTILKNSRRRLAGLGLVGLMLASLLAACGGETATSGSVATTAATGATTAAGAGATTAAGASSGGTNATGGSVAALPANCTNVQLQYWNPFTGPDGPFMGNMVNRFNSANPNIKVTMTTQAEYYIQMGTAAASDALPDVAIIHADQIATQAYRNILRPIDDIAKNIGADASDFPAPVWKAGEVNGKRYSIPLDIHPAVLYYNEDLLKKAGVNAAPKTNDEFQKAAQAVAGQSGSKGFMLSTGFFSRQIFETMLNQFGGSAFNADGSKATFNSEAGVRAMTFLKDAQTKYSEQKLETDAELNAFKTGNTGLIFNGIWQTSNVTGKGVSFAGKATAVPQLGTQMAVWAGSHQLALPTRKNSDACKDAAASLFIKYLVDNSLEWSKAGQIPASNAVRNSADFKAIEPQASIAPSVEKAFFPPAVPGITDAYVPLDETVTAILTGQASDVKAALDDAAKRADQILADNKSKYATPPK